MADGFFEWEHKKQPRQPYHIINRDKTPFGFAGLWERWHPPEGGEPVESCTIITTTNEVIGRLHDLRGPGESAFGSPWMQDSTQSERLRERVRRRESACRTAKHW